MKNVKESNFFRNEILKHRRLVRFIEVVQEICTNA